MRQRQCYGKDQALSAEKTAKKLLKKILWVSSVNWNKFK